MLLADTHRTPQWARIAGSAVAMVTSINLVKANTLYVSIMFPCEDTEAEGITVKWTEMTLVIPGNKAVKFTSTLK